MANRAPLIHLVEDDRELANYLCEVLRSDGFRVSVFDSVTAYQHDAMAHDAPVPDAVVMDMMFPEGQDAGATLIRELGLGADSGIPVVVVSARDDIHAPLAAFRAGACRYLTKPVLPQHLVELLNQLTRRRPIEAYRVLMVDDDELLVATHASILRSAGMDVRTLTEPLRLFDTLNGFTPDVIVLDVYMPDATGPELSAVLRERESLVHVPILYLSGEADLTQQLLALNLGGDDFLVKPVQPIHLLAAVSDRARRSRQKSELQKRLDIAHYERERQHMALEQHGMVSITDATGAIIYVNPKFCEISGYTQQELIGQNHRLLKSENHSAGFYESLWQTISSGNVWHGEFSNRNKNGANFSVEMTITPFIGRSGRPYQYAAIGTDVTAQHNTELALRHSEDLSLGILNSVDAQIAVLDHEGTILRVNQAWRKFAEDNGLNPELASSNVAIGTNYLNVCDTAVGVSAEGSREVRIGLLNVLAGRLPRFSMSYPCHSPTQERWFTLIATPLEIAGGGAVVAHLDISSLKRTEQALIMAREQADAANLAKSEFLTNMSHELRTPLNALLGYAQLFASDQSLTQEQKMDATEMESSGKQLLALMTDVLDFSKIDTEGLALRLEPLIVSTLTRQAFPLLADAARRGGIALIDEGGDAAEGVIEVDSVRLLQALVSLMDNAIKYNRPHGSARLSYTLHEDKVRIKVTDNGIGIPWSKQDKLFTAFERLGFANSAILGSGIGLVIAKRIVEAMGGTVGFESVEGQGSCFWFEFPAFSSPS